jgi:hypothetical protein
LGEAWGSPGSPARHKRTVVVKAMAQGATPAEQMCFLHEARPFRDVKHPNVLQLVGRCLEVDPFLVMLEYCPLVRQFTTSCSQFFLNYFLIIRPPSSIFFA